MEIDDISDDHEKMVREYFQAIPKDSTVLDAGCGGGKGCITKILHDLKFDNIDGVDFLRGLDITHMYRSVYFNDLYTFDFDRYDIIVACDITYIHLCDPINRVRRLLKRLQRKCDRLVTVLDYKRHLEKDWCISKAHNGEKGPRKEIIRNVANDEEAMDAFPFLDQFAIHENYGVYIND